MELEGFPANQGSGRWKECGKMGYCMGMQLSIMKMEISLNTKCRMGNPTGCRYGRRAMEPQPTLSGKMDSAMVSKESMKGTQLRRKNCMKMGRKCDDF